MKLYGKEKNIERLTAFARSGRFPHGLLLCGEQGAGKGVLADYIAMLHLCVKHGESPCFSCAECRRIEQHIHPDVVYIDGKSCKAEDMRRLVHEGYKLPNDGETRVYVLESFDLCAEVCQNILLKFIEEPLVFNRFVLTAESVSGILPTILSRVVKLDVPLASTEQCRSALCDAGVPAQEAARLSEAFNGNIGRCLCAHSGEDGQGLSLTAVASDIIKDIISGSEYDAAVKIQSLSSRDELNGIFPLLLEMFRDAMAVFCGGREPVSFDKSAGVKLSGRYPIKKLYEAAALLEKYIGMSRVNYNLNIAANAFTAELFGILK